MPDATTPAAGPERSEPIEQRLRLLAGRADATAPSASAIGLVAESEGILDIGWTVVDSPIGALVVAATADGLLRLSFSDVDETLEPLAAEVSPRILEGGSRLDPVRRELDEYFAGSRRSFDLALDTRLSAGFRGHVLEHLRRVPYGSTVSYAELATAAGSPRATRAVGSSMATNPIPIVVPCHRVLRSDGTLGGYAGGLEAKEWLLEREGVQLPRR